MASQTKPTTPTSAATPATSTPAPLFQAPAPVTQAPAAPASITSRPTLQGLPPQPGKAAPKAQNQQPNKLTPETIKFHVNLYKPVKLSLYLTSVFILACALEMFALDDIAKRERYKKSNQKEVVGSRLHFYILFILNASGPVAIYFFSYDGYLFKLLLFLASILGSVILRAFIGLHFHWLHNLPNFVGLLLASELLFTIIISVKNWELVRKLQGSRGSTKKAESKLGSGAEEGGSSTGTTTPTSSSAFATISIAPTGTFSGPASSSSTGTTSSSQTSSASASSGPKVASTSGWVPLSGTQSFPPAVALTKSSTTTSPTFGVPSTTTKSSTALRASSRIADLPKSVAAGKKMGAFQLAKPSKGKSRTPMSIASKWGTPKSYNGQKPKSGLKAAATESKPSSKAGAKSKTKI